MGEKERKPFQLTFIGARERGTRAATLLVELGPILHIHPHP